MTRNTSFRKAAQNSNFPYTKSTVPFILIQGSEITWAQTKADKMELLQRACCGKILAVWPGKIESDVFEIDPVTALAELEDSEDEEED